MIQKLLDWLFKGFLRNMDVGMYSSPMDLIELLKYPVRMKVFTQTLLDLSAVLTHIRDMDEICHIYQSLQDAYWSIFGPKRDKGLLGFLGFMEETYPFLAKGG